MLKPSYPPYFDQLSESQTLTQYNQRFCFSLVILVIMMIFWYDIILYTIYRNTEGSTAPFLTL